ncbi:hypothetical protein [Moorena bouillonii]|nr:hypothetical protein [Moorena bouillonii]
MGRWGVWGDGEMGRCRCRVGSASDRLMCLPSAGSALPTKD